MRTTDKMNMYNKMMCCNGREMYHVMLDLVRRKS
jgi:hypothetical protein